MLTLIYFYVRNHVSVEKNLTVYVQVFKPPVVVSNDTTTSLGKTFGVTR